MSSLGLLLWIGVYKDEIYREGQKIPTENELRQTAPRHRDIFKLTVAAAAI